MTLDKQHQDQTDTQLRDLQRVAQKYGASNDLAVYSQLTFDV